MLLHSTRRALNEGARKAAHSLEPHQSPAAPQAVQSPWTTGLLCIVRFGASVVRIACSAQWASGPAPVPGISPCATRHWLQFSLAGDAQASRRDDGRAASALLLDSSPPPLPPPFSLDSHRTQTTIASPIPPQQAASSRQKLTLQRGPSHPQGTHVTAHIFLDPLASARFSQRPSPHLPPAGKKNCVSCRKAPSHTSISRKLPAASSPTPNSSTRIDAPFFGSGFLDARVSPNRLSPKTHLDFHPNPQSLPSSKQFPTRTCGLADCGRQTALSNPRAWEAFRN